MRPFVVLAFLALIVARARAPRGVANGDPPSHELRRADFYLPSEPASPALVLGFRTALSRVFEAGYPVKVAIVQSRSDFGDLRTAFGRPQEYADYLARDLRKHPDVPRDSFVLVVTPTGSGIAGRRFTARERAAARAVDVHAGATSDELITATTTTVQRMAAAAGAGVNAEGSEPVDGGSGWGPAAGIAAGAVALVVAALPAARARRRRRAGDTTPS